MYILAKSFLKINISHFHHMATLYLQLRWLIPQQLVRDSSVVHLFHLRSHSHRQFVRTFEIHRRVMHGNSVGNRTPGFADRTTHQSGNVTLDQGGVLLLRIEVLPQRHHQLLRQQSQVAERARVLRPQKFSVISDENEKIIGRRRCAPRNVHVLISFFSI